MVKRVLWSVVAVAAMLFVGLLTVAAEWAAAQSLTDAEVQAKAQQRRAAERRAEAPMPHAQRLQITAHYETRIGEPDLFIVRDAATGREYMIAKSDNALAVCALGGER